MNGKDKRKEEEKKKREKRNRRKLLLHKSTTSNIDFTNTMSGHMQWFVLERIKSVFYYLGFQ